MPVWSCMFFRHSPGTVLGVPWGPSTQAGQSSNLSEPGMSCRHRSASSSRIVCLACPANLDTRCVQSFGGVPFLRPTLRTELGNMCKCKFAQASHVSSSISLYWKPWVHRTAGRNLLSLRILNPFSDPVKAWFPLSFVCEMIRLIPLYVAIIALATCAPRTPASPPLGSISPQWVTPPPLTSHARLHLPSVALWHLLDLTPLLLKYFIF